MRRRGIQRPDARSVVGAASSEVSDIWGEQDSGNVGTVGGKFADGDNGGGVVTLDHAPNIDVALSVMLGQCYAHGGAERETYGIVTSTHHATI